MLIGKLSVFQTDIRSSILLIRTISLISPLNSSFERGNFFLYLGSLLYLVSFFPSLYLSSFFSKGTPLLLSLFCPFLGILPSLFFLVEKEENMEINIGREKKSHKNDIFEQKKFGVEQKE